MTFSNNVIVANYETTVVSPQINTQNHKYTPVPSCNLFKCDVNLQIQNQNCRLRDKNALNTQSSQKNLIKMSNLNSFCLPLSYNCCIRNINHVSGLKCFSSTTSQSGRVCLHYVYTCCINQGRKQHLCSAFLSYITFPFIFSDSHIQFYKTETIQQMRHTMQLCIPFGRDCFCFRLSFRVT